MDTNHVGAAVSGIVLRCAMLVVGVCLSGCSATVITQDRLEEVEIGISTQEDVREALGEPQSVSTVMNEGVPSEVWVYQYAARDPYGVPPIGMTGVPISRGFRKPVSIEVRFDAGRVVKDIRQAYPQ